LTAPALARRAVHLALDQVKAHARALLVLRLAYLLELADLILSDLDSVERLKRAAALGGLLDALEFDLHFEWLLTYWEVEPHRSGPRTALAGAMGALFEEFNRLADSAEREGRREEAEFHRLFAQAAFVTGRAIEIYHELAESVRRTGFIHASSWVEWDAEGYRMLADTEWYRQARREILGAALAGAPLESVRKALERRAAELVQHALKPWVLWPEEIEIARRRFKMLPKTAFNPFLKTDAEAAKLLEELRELNLLERLREVVEKAKGIAEELNRRRARSGG
jgi:hypothetical protein